MAKYRAELTAEAGPRQPYHNVRPSPWPMLSSLAGGLAAAGAVTAIHGGISWILIVGVLCVLVTLAGWWRDVLHESVVERAHSPVVKLSLRYGMALFIASEVMFFVAFFWAFFGTSLFPMPADMGVWPPPGIVPIDPLRLPLAMTIVLLASSGTVTWAHKALRKGETNTAIAALAVTIALAIIFMLGQLYEYNHAEFGFHQGIFGSTFYMATGFHGIHVLLGALFLLVVLWRTYKRQFSPESHFGFEAATWYWHTINVAGIFLFFSIYAWGGMTRGTPINPNGG